MKKKNIHKVQKRKVLITQLFKNKMIKFYRLSKIFTKKIKKN